METVINENNKYELYVNTIKTCYRGNYEFKYKKNLAPLNDEYSVIKKLNSKVEDFILTYTELCIKEANTILELYLHIKEKCLQLSLCTIISNSLKYHVEIVKSIIVKAKNDDDFNSLKEIARDLSVDDNDNSLIKNLNNLITTNVELIDYNIKIDTNNTLFTDDDLIRYITFRISIDENIYINK